jgi:DNA-binding MarR family transcriptional regulator
MLDSMTSMFPEPVMRFVVKKSASPKRATNQAATTAKEARSPAKKAATRAAAASYVPPLTISRADFLKDGHDRAFRDGLYVMVMALDGLLRCRDQFGRALGLTGSQFAVLIGAAYRQGPDGVTIRDLAEHVRLAPPHVTTEVSRLIKMGLLVKRPNKVDRRSVLVSLSPSGETAVEQVTPMVRGVNDVLLQNISHSDFQAVVRVMRLLMVNTDTAFSELHRGGIPRAGKVG